jgi:hypothetical protein
MHAVVALSLMPRMMLMASSMVGSSTITARKRRSRALSLQCISGILERAVSDGVQLAAPGGLEQVIHGALAPAVGPDEGASRQ